MNTGNASSQSLLGFFHSTGYQGVTPVDQAKAQLYYTFAASGGSRGAQMALGYRYWTGIGVLEDCNRAVEWYERAAEQCKPFISIQMQLLIRRIQQLKPSILVRQVD
jgi:SEL1 protein